MMDAAKQRRIKEANDCIKKAEDCLKTSIIKLKFKSDYDSAAVEYQRAAVCFKNADNCEKAYDAFLKAALMHSSNGNVFHSAKCKESAAMVCKEMGDTENAMRYMEEAADEYAESGSCDTAAMTLDKAATFLENLDPTKAIKLYEKALTLVQQTDRSRLAGDFLNHITRINIKLEHYGEAVQSLEREIEMYMDIKEFGRVGQLTNALVLVHLTRGDSIAASKCLQVSSKCNGTEISEIIRECNSLIMAYELGNDENLMQILQRPVFKSMDNEYLRLMKRLRSQKNEGHVDENQSSFNDEGDEEDLK